MARTLVCELDLLGFAEPEPSRGLACSGQMELDQSKRRAQ